MERNLFSSTLPSPIHLIHLPTIHKLICASVSFPPSVHPSFHRSVTPKTLGTHSVKMSQLDSGGPEVTQSRSLPTL